jgi:hypothetical protein
MNQIDKLLYNMCNLLSLVTAFNERHRRVHYKQFLNNLLNRYSFIFIRNTLALLSYNLERICSQSVTIVELWSRSTDCVQKGTNFKTKSTFGFLQYVCNYIIVS